MSTGRKQITADHIGNLHLDKDASVLSAMATDGPSQAEGRDVQVFMADDVIRGLLAHLATDRRWSAAFDAVQANREALIAETAGNRCILPGQLRSRARLTEAMRSAMAVRDGELPVRASWEAGRAGALRAASRPDATDDEAERAVDVVQGTQTRVSRLTDLGMRPEDTGPALEAADAQAAREDETRIWWALPEGSEQSERTENRTHRLSLPETAPESEKEMYAALISYGSAIVAAERGEVTELVRPGGQVAARIVPS
jgi:hypothetical protein